METDGLFTAKPSAIQPPPMKPVAGGIKLELSANTITDDVLASLDAMSKAELITLIKRLLCQCGTVAMMTDEEQAQAMLDRLAAASARNGAKTADIVASVTAWMDRKQGKPVQKQLIAAKIETRASNDPDLLKDAARRIEFLLARPQDVG